ncbi:DUF448 domain-containing protein [Sphingomonas sp.]|jgi:hypothetical protein|uniref:DUF448 domain-containing protein n=1 Tax=Sphingomonas sp. TaxID=28214 RepID=UPI002E364EAC|nr:DUF448 domain-containing protein [Sphingomonas sp.]HEX4695280.1 DUF448 domain-containing protein [Sphingomonas sp.]
MRTPRNETALGPERTCILSREHDAREGLIRLALAPDGQVLPDIRAKAPGRGAWIGVSRAELDAANAKGKLKAALARAFKTNELTTPADLGAMIADQLQRGFLDRLGLESKSGNLTTGTAKIETAARSGQVHLLLHASDARPDGTGKLAQAWRVGRDLEGSGEQGLALPVSRTILSLALGRENVVHIAVTDRAAAGRIREMLDRWRHFIGPDLTPEPCETASQGASALPGESHGTGGTAEDLKDFE